MKSLRKDQKMMKDKISIKNALLKVCEHLKNADIKGSGRESAMILSEVLDKSIEYIYTHFDDEFSSENLGKLLKMAEKRTNGMPMAYVLGKKEFFGLEFKVDSNVLIPRPETEMMIETAIDWAESFEKDEKLLVLDIGTGSGCIPIAIAKNIKENVEFLATDLSEKALKVTKSNVEFHKLKNIIKLEKSDLLKDVNVSIFDQKNVLITANLPYLSKEIYEDSPSSVQDFEPKEALISGINGLDHYRKLFKQIIEKDILNISSSINILLEISPEQKDGIEKLAEEEFGDNMEISTKKDLAGKWRLVLINFNL